MSKQKSAASAKPSSPPLTEDKKRQAFLRLRNENYIASLRLEGLSVPEAGTVMPLALLKQKYVG